MTCRRLSVTQQIMKRLLITIWLATMGAGLGSPPGMAQDAAPENIGLALFDVVTERARSAIEHPATEDGDLARIRKSLKGLEREARKTL